MPEMADHSPFGIPMAARRGRLPHGLVVKTGGKRKDVKNGKTRFLPDAYDHFKVGTQPRDPNSPLVEHPAFRGKEPQVLEIELVSNDIGMFYMDWLDCYAGRKPFCSNKQGGNVAMRLTPRGGLAPVTCDPSACPFFLAGEAATAAEAKAEIRKHWMEQFQYVKDSSGKPTLNTDTTCAKNCYFFFHILDPQDPERYITSAGLPARLYTQSKHSTENLSMGLLDIFNAYRGRLAGLRCKLRIAFQLTPFNTRVPVVTIEAQMGKGQIEEMARMGRMLNSRDVNMDHALKELGAMSPDEVKAVDWQHISSEYSGVPALPAPEHPVQIAPPGPREYKFATADPFAVALIRRLKYSNANIAFLEVKYGDNLEGLLGALRSHADSSGIDIGDLVSSYRPNEAIPEAEIIEEKTGNDPGGGESNTPDSEELPGAAFAQDCYPAVPGLTPVDSLQSDDLVKD